MCSRAQTDLQQCLCYVGLLHIRDSYTFGFCAIKHEPARVSFIVEGLY